LTGASESRAEHLALLRAEAGFRKLDQFDRLQIATKRN
jgi:hypothetical protein